jgi:hypothetical protein
VVVIENFNFIIFISLRLSGLEGSACVSLNLDVSFCLLHGVGVLHIEKKKGKANIINILMNPRHDSNQRNCGSIGIKNDWLSRCTNCFTHSWEDSVDLRLRCVTRGTPTNEVGWNIEEGHGRDWRLGRDGTNWHHRDLGFSTPGYKKEREKLN